MNQPTPPKDANIRDILSRSLIVVEGEKGGIGKTHLVTLLACYLLEVISDLVVFDGDRANRTCKSYLENLTDVGLLALTEDKEENFQMDRIAERFVDTDKNTTVLLDTPAQAKNAFKHSLLDGAVSETLRDLNVKVIVLYVVTADRLGLDQFLRVRQDLNKFIDNWILVKNLYGATASAFQKLMSDKQVVSAKKRTAFVEMYLSELRKPEIVLVREQKLPITLALEKTNVCGKTRLLRYKREFEKALIEALQEVIK